MYYTYMEKEKYNLKIGWIRIKGYDDRIVILRSDSGKEREFSTIYKRKKVQS